MRPARLLIVLSLLSAAAGAASLDAGLRASIWDDNYKLGVGGELGAILPAGGMELGVHFNYSHFRQKTEGWGTANEMGGNVALYFTPSIDQPFKLRLGPHVGAAYLKTLLIDLGADASAVFKTTPSMSFYASFIPAWFWNVKEFSESQALIRVGFGLQFHLGGQAPAAEP